MYGHDKRETSRCQERDQLCFTLGETVSLVFDAIDLVGCRADTASMCPSLFLIIVTRINI